MLSAVASATQDSRFERLKNLKPPALPGDSYCDGCQSQDEAQVPHRRRLQGCKSTPSEQCSG
jgi:hypothetical protein